MDTKLVFTPAAEIETELLSIFVVDISTSKEKDAPQQLVLLSGEQALTATAQTVLASGEFKGEANETLLLHAPAGVEAKRLLLIGLGNAAKISPHDVRKGAGTAVRFAKPRGIRALAIAVTTSDALAAQATVRSMVEGALGA